MVQLSKMAVRIARILFIDFFMPLLHIPLPLPFLARIVVDHLILYQLFPRHISQHHFNQLTYTSFTIRRQPFVAAPSFTVAGQLRRTLPRSFNIIVDSFQERPESSGHSRSRSLARSQRYLAYDLLVVEYSVLCFRSRKEHPIKNIQCLKYCTDKKNN